MATIWFEIGARFDKVENLWVPNLSYDLAKLLSMYDDKINFVISHGCTGSDKNTTWIYRVNDKDDSIVSALKAEGIVPKTLKQIEDVASKYEMSNKRLEEEDARTSLVVDK